LPLTSPKHARLHRKLLTVSEHLAMLGIAILAGLAVYTVTDIILRLFSLSLPGTVDIVSYGLAIAIATIMPYGFLADQHISISAGIDRLAEKPRAILAALTKLISSIFLAWLAGSTFLYAADRKEVHDTMWILNIEIWPIWYVLAVLFIFTFFASLFQAWIAIDLALSTLTRQKVEKS